VNKEGEVLDMALGKYELENKASPDPLANFLKLATQQVGIPEFYKPISGRSYFDCAMLGFIAFLGANPDEDAPLNSNFSFLTIAAQFAKRTGALLLLKQQRGYYETIFRNISRNINSLVAASAADPATFLFTGGIESIFSAGIVDIVQIFAKSGDMLYLRYDANASFELGSTAPSVPAGSRRGGDLGRSYAMKRTRFQRISEGSRNTSLDGSQIPALRLLPVSYHESIKDSPTSLSALILGSESVQPSKNGKNRFTEEQVAEIEDLLESEYMPFYFQDLRTNEIVSFNAFLDDVSDGFQAEYSSISGYGRIEDAKIYKGTKRSLGVKFHLFAANADDFDTMWWQINKLTTMVYPQWSRGRELQIKQGNDVKVNSLNSQSNSQTFPFIQPFSQIPTATPVIRVRVGDLIRSNYSRFNLKRLFGFKDPEIGTKQENAGGDFSFGTEDTLSTVVVDAPATPGRAAVPARSIPLKVKDDVKYSWKSERDPTQSTSIIIKAGTVLTPTKDGKYTIPYGAGTLKIEKSVVQTTGGGFTKAVDYTAGTQAQTRTVSGTLGSITPGGRSITSADFYNPDQNAIIRSFESTMGKGLPAVCTSLKLGGWMDMPWGAGMDGPGYRAPRYCTVDMQFEVMHDIAPGLDSEGFNRAPIYPVGDTIPLLVEGGEKNPYGRGTKTSQESRSDYNIAVKK